ncbi:hypothetical protein ACMA5I_06905 [Paracoccaceae bacterium GXU_MW_L88]
MKLFALLPFLIAAPLAAQEVSDCRDNYITHAENIAEPWADNTATFANGDVRIAVMDTLEPAAAAFHLLILSPPYGEAGERQCRLVSANNRSGFATLTLDGLESDYDPETGLTLVMTAGLFGADMTEPEEHTLIVTLNQASGDVTAALK